MPHFFAKSLDSLENVANRSGKYFDFVLEAINPRDKSTLILAQNKSDFTQKIMLLKQQKNDKFLVKFNKHFKVQSREAIKNALKDYAKLTNADIIAHNLNANKAEAQSQYLLDSRGILGLFGESARFRDFMVEIGFGSGRHILNLAQNNPNTLIIGLEIYRPAILQVLRQIELLGLQNLYLASIDARVLFEVLPRESLSAIFLHFPVPWDKNPQRRVFSEVFLSNAIATLKPQEGRFELITDSKEYFDFAKDLAKIYKHKVTINPKNEVVSKYEARWKKLKKEIYKLEIFPLKGNLFWGMQFAPFSHKTALDERSSSISLVSRKNGAKPHRHYFDCRGFATNLKNFVIARFGNAESKQSKQNNLHEVQTESRPIRGAKNRIQTSSSASADFLLEKELRGTPPKSEKAAAFWRVGGAGRGVQPFLRKEKGDKELKDSSVDLSAESHKEMDSRFALDSRDLDSSLTAFAQNDESMDCHESLRDSRNDESTHDSAFAESRNDGMGVDCFGQSPRNDEMSLPPKICKKEYFLQIKDKYEFGGGFVIYVVFGAYYAPNSAYIIVRKNSKYCEILGDIIPTKANLSALNELQCLGSYA